MCATANTCLIYTVKGRLESREEHGMPKSYWVRPGAPPAQWLKARRRVLTEEMQGNLLPSNVVEAMGPLSSLIRLVSSNDHREQIRNELYPLLREALQGGDPLRADAPKACRTSLVCGVNIEIPQSVGRRRDKGNKKRE